MVIKLFAAPQNHAANKVIVVHQDKFVNVRIALIIKRILVLVVTSHHAVRRRDAVIFKNAVTLVIVVFQEKYVIAKIV